MPPNFASVQDLIATIRVIVLYNPIIHPRVGAIALVTSLKEERIPNIAITHIMLIIDLIPARHVIIG